MSSIAVQITGESHDFTASLIGVRFGACPRGKTEGAVDSSHAEGECRPAEQRSRIA
jgi:hypothetical protein